MSEQPGYPSQYPSRGYPPSGSPASNPQDRWSDGSPADPYGAQAQPEPYGSGDPSYGAPSQQGGVYGSARPADQSYPAAQDQYGYGSPPPSSGSGGYGAPPPSSGAGGYGSPPPSSGGAYGAPPSSGGAYGAPSSGSGYGGYGAAPTSSDAYGAPPAPSYGAPTSSGGYGAPASSGGYGAPASSGGYGAPTSAGGYGAPTSSGGYGAPAAPASSDAYGAPPAPTYGMPQGQDQYGASQPPGYGAPPSTPWQQQPGGKPPPSGTNGFAIASLILGIIGGVLLSVIFAFVALSQIKKRNQSGRGLAIGGLVFSALWVVGVIAVVVIAVATSGTSRNDAGQITEEGSVSSFDLQPGDCLNGLTESENITSLPAVPCAQPHDGEVFATFDVAGAAFPGDAALADQAEKGCVQRLPEYSKKAENDEALEIYFLHPTAESWAQGDHEVTCVALDATKKRTGSIKD